MSRCSDQAAVNYVPVLFFEHGDPVTVHGQPDFNITAVVEEVTTTEQQEDLDLSRPSALKLTVITDSTLGASLGYGSVQPFVDLRFTVNGERYRCERISRDAPLAELTLVREDVSAHTRPRLNATRRS